MRPLREHCGTHRRRDRHSRASNASSGSEDDRGGARSSRATTDSASGALHHVLPLSFALSFALAFAHRTGASRSSRATTANTLNNDVEDVPVFKGHALFGDDLAGERVEVLHTLLVDKLAGRARQLVLDRLGFFLLQLAEDLGASKVDLFNRANHKGVVRVAAVGPIARNHPHGDTVRAIEVGDSTIGRVLRAVLVVVGVVP